MKTHLFTFLPLAGRMCRFFSLSLLFISPYCLLAQSDKAWQAEVGIEHYAAYFDESKAAVGGFFVEGKYQRKQFDFGIKAGSPMWQYGQDQLYNSSTERAVSVGQGNLSRMKLYLEAAVNYKPNFKHGKPFFGIGLRYMLHHEGTGEVVYAFRRDAFNYTLPTYLAPVIRLGYYHKQLKLQLNYIAKGITGLGAAYSYYSSYINFGASWVFGIGERLSTPSPEILFAAKERTFRPLAFRLEVGLLHTVAWGKTGVGSAAGAFAEARIGLNDKLRLGLRAEGHGELGADTKTREIYAYADNRVLGRDANAGAQMSAYILFAEWVLKSNVTKDILTVGAGAGIYANNGTGPNGYVDNGAWVSLPQQVKSGIRPGLHLRVGQRFGAFSHGIHVNVMPGILPVTAGVHLGLGLNVFGKAKAPQ